MCLLGAGAAHAQTSHEGWPKIDGVLKINKDDGNDTVHGTAKSDELLGGHGNDTIRGGPAAAVSGTSPIGDALRSVQSDLFTIGSHLAVADGALDFSPVP